MSHGSSDFTFKKAIDIVHSHKLAQEQLRTMVSNSNRANAATASQAVHAICQREHGGYRTDTKCQSYGNFARGSRDIAKRNKICGICAKEHDDNEELPAKKRQCNNCKRFTKVCRAQTQQPQRRMRTVHAVDEDRATEQMD